jgi:hypothetical protein
MKKTFGAVYGVRVDAALMKGLKEQYGEKNVVFQ